VGCSLSTAAFFLTSVIYNEEINETLQIAERPFCWFSTNKPNNQTQENALTVLKKVVVDYLKTTIGLRFWPVLAFRN